MSNNPKTVSFLAPQGFQLYIKRAPNVNFFVQNAPIPGVELGVAEIVNPFINIPVPGDHMSFEELEIVFKVDEDLANYLEVYTWLKTLGKPSSFKDLAKLTAQPDYTQLGIYSDITLLIQNSKNNIKFEVLFEDAFPTALSGINFDATAEDVDYLQASARFIYREHSIKKVV